jgi:hypothetical protein
VANEERPSAAKASGELALCGTAEAEPFQNTTDSDCPELFVSKLGCEVASSYLHNC